MRRARPPATPATPATPKPPPRTPPAARALPPAQLGAAHQHATALLRDAGVATPDADASWLLEDVTGLSPARQRLVLHTPLNLAARRRLARRLARRAAREPLQLILGETDFRGLRLRLRHGVLVPRPETEMLVELALADLPSDLDATVLDVGCGSGAVALALAAERPCARVLASDTDPRALALTRRNARALGLPVRAVRADLLDHPRLWAAARTARLLLANLPYLPEADRAALPPELAWELPEALLAGPDGLRLARRLRAQAWRALRPGAVAWWELDPRNAGAFAREARMLGWRGVRLAPDLVGRRRFVRLLR